MSSRSTASSSTTSCGRWSSEEPGAVAGREVVQIYVSKPDGVIEQPSLELADFAKTRMLAPGDTQELMFTIVPDALVSWDERSAAHVAVPAHTSCASGGPVRTRRRQGASHSTSRSSCGARPLVCLPSTGVGACYKHIVANNAESARKRNQSLVSERALRELYLRAFEIALRTHPAKTVMTAYNAVNGVPTAADPELIQGFLREELGFDGAVITDWSTYDTCDVVDMVLGGNTWITPGGQDDTHTRPIVEAVASGRLPIELLRENVTYLVRTVAR
ncbi:glycoside hydrolase family 3 N-terminal domain-containing protein [Streptomyces sp. NPDC050433]|uniref:glycoside hydrolase family 3 N-terminal domain-containing protein n=1 Tax=Streptomyces sp. NPDC050433 TaxID=3365615 RepID=UPI003794A1CE